ncbi:MAG: YraN family protein [Firmicutes bacterium]|nr:YraN family protein [Candidatus Fermentithermobacillaceae bacterium]
MKAGAAGHIIGRKAETLACDYLREKDYRIICRNYRSTYGEIDIVAAQQSVLVFVEVRYKKRGSLLTPQESVSRAKVRRLKLAVRDFLYKHSGILRHYDCIRVDLVCASESGEPPSLEFNIVKGIIEF